VNIRGIEKLRMVRMELDASSCPPGIDIWLNRAISVSGATLVDSTSRHETVTEEAIEEGREETQE
jgi:hypothetical protein